MRVWIVVKRLLVVGVMAGLSAVLLAALGPMAASAQAAVFTVKTTASSGEGSLAEEIADSNGAAPGPNTVRFAIGSGAKTISPTLPLPVISRPVLIDGTTQPGFSGKPLIRLDGAHAGSKANGLTISAGKSTVRGLELTGWGNAGILLETKGSDRVTGTYVGTNGATALHNRLGIVLNSGSSANTIGGTTAATGNLISGNTSDGVQLQGSGTSHNVIEGNFIGTNAAGTAAIANGFGVLMIVGPADNTVGGTVQGAGNLISGNATGVDILDGSSNAVEGNLIGTNAAGTAALGNGSPTGNPLQDVAVYQGSTNNTIGGTSAAARNVISGAKGDGVDVTGTGTTGNLVEGNYIGTNAAGAAALPNNGSSVAVFAGATGNTVGGAVAGASNVISGSPNDGVLVDGTGTSGNLVEGNLIGTNAAGTAALANGLDGVLINQGASNNLVGGTGAGTGNVISGNTQNGVGIVDSGTTGNVVEGNLIGTDAAGTAALPNGIDGVRIRLGASGDTIGGVAAGAGNTIADNVSNGVEVNGTTTIAHDDAIEGNLIFGNGSLLGIALTSGGNDNLAPPAITQVTGPTVSGTVGTGTFRIEVFANPSCADPEGRQFLGSVTTSNGNWTLQVSPALTPGEGITATATDTSTFNTSQFSTCQPA